MQERSPLELYSEQVDEKYCDFSYMWIYHNLAKKIDPIYLTRIFIDDLKYRSNHQRNVVASIEGQQGCQPKGSKVLLANGVFKNIEEIKVGDEVISLQYNGNVTFEKVVNCVSWFCEDMFAVISNRTNKLLYKCSFNHLIPLTLDCSFLLNVLATPKEIIKWQEKISCWCQQVKQSKIKKNWVMPIKELINFRVETAKPEQVFGITISGNSNLYITDNMIVTHNCGKSLFGVALSTILGNLFNNPFVIDRDIYVNPSQLDYDLREGENRRRTFFYDEQPSQQVGIGSVSTQLALRDYEEICRHTQNNLIYASPEIQEHAHYFVFKQVDYDPPRLVNKTCLTCPKYDDCVSNFYSTLCPIPFYKRNGYPLKFNFMLYTKRLADKIFVPRGIISLPMVQPQIALNYNQVKAKNIKNFESYASDTYKKHIERLDEFVIKYKEHLIKSKINKFGVKIFGVQNKDVIEGWFYDYFSKGRYVTRDVEIYIALIKQKLEHIVEGLNVQE